MQTARILSLLWLLWLAGLHLGARAAWPTPEGYWQSFDDTGRVPQAVVHIEAERGRLVGRIIKVLDPRADPHETCNRCTGEWKDKPLVGLEIITGVDVVARDGAWGAGQILDPEDGRLYRVRLELDGSGDSLLVRGYWGPFWRTQKWTRLKGPGS